MKKNYSYILWIFFLLIFFFTLKKNDEFNQTWVDSQISKMELERFCKSRLDEHRVEEINNIISKANEKRMGAFLEGTYRQKIEEESQKAANYVKDLAKKYPQVKGRIIIGGTKIDFPIVQGTDNEYYLDHNYKNEYYINGGVFIDHVHKGDFSNDNTVIYGHNVRIGYIFHDLDKFRDKNFIKNHSQIIIDTPLARRVFDVVCAMDLDVDANYRAYSYDGLDFENYLKLIKENNILKDKPLPSRNDKIITLSTCSDFKDRFAIVAIERKDKYVRPKDFDHKKDLLLEDKRATNHIFIY
ncbi:class B sortase [uncultured Anaerococcus sp.]|uniref:class B sortase n=1 Tax=uncultured Anaerococcus sp. TaxID=293428 RepID=UPI00288C5131|nr:class B sortase [uncultured Anaerococcus sp.]